MMTTTQQMELRLERTKMARSLRRRRTRASQARWWFSQMRLAVETSGLGQAGARNVAFMPLPSDPVEPAREFEPDLVESVEAT